MPRNYVLDDNERYNSLLLKRQLLEPPSKELIQPLLQQMEFVRVREGLSMRRFSILLDLTETHYSKILQGKRGLTIEALLTFCRVFGYDISTLINSAYLSNADSVFMELSMYLSRLDKKTVKKIADDIVASDDESESSKKLGKELLDRLVHNDKPMAFYLSDSKLEAPASFMDKDALQNTANEKRTSQRITTKQTDKK